jgi:hypothetical protein
VWIIRKASYPYGILQEAPMTKTRDLEVACPHCHRRFSVRQAIAASIKPPEPNAECEMCGKPFRAIRPLRARYCSPACSQKAHRRRAREERLRVHPA